METGQKNLLVFNIRRASVVSAAIRAVFPGARAAPARRREIRRRSSPDYVTLCYRFSTTRGPLPHSLWKTRPAPVAPRRKRVTIITPRPRIPVQGRWPWIPFPAAEPPQLGNKTQNSPPDCSASLVRGKTSPKRTRRCKFVPDRVLRICIGVLFSYTPAADERCSFQHWNTHNVVAHDSLETSFASHIDPSRSASQPVVAADHSGQSRSALPGTSGL